MPIAPLKLRVSSIVSIILLLSVACSDDDDNNTVTGPDKTPPGVESVTPVDEYHIDVKFTEPVTESAEYPDNYLITETGTFPSQSARASVPGDTLMVYSAVLRPDGRTVTITTEGSMAGFSYSLSVNYVVDVSGNPMTTESVKPFNGSSDFDQTPPSIVSRSPAPGATGVPIGATITVKFSEPVIYGSLVGGTTLRGSTGAAVDCQFGSGAPTVYTFTPRNPLQPGTSYTLSVNASDLSNTAMNSVQWSFTTTNTVDTTLATLNSTFPPHLATNVDVSATFSMIFSEAMQEDEIAIEIVPDAGEYIMQWSGSGQSVTLRFSESLFEDQQYLVTIYADGSTDFSGNELGDLYTVLFTTGSALAEGSISGTITGDAGTAAADPAGALVLAASGPLLSGNVAVLGGAVVDANGAYTISNLPDGVYFPLVFMDTTGDGFLVGTGDALGGFGMNLETSELEPDSVVIAGGTQATGVDILLFDPSGIRGTLAYGGVYASNFLDAYVGIFDTVGFDLTNPPLAVSHRFWPYAFSWSFNALTAGIPDGDYYAAAFLDTDGSGTFDPLDPFGVYGGAESPTVLHIENGSDILGIVIEMQGPTGPGPSVSVAWPREKHHTRLDRLLEAVQKSGIVAKK